MIPPPPPPIPAAAPPAPALPPPTQTEVDAWYAEWQTIHSWMKKAKEREAELRLILADAIFAPVKLPTGAFPEGTTRRSDFGYSGSLGSKWNRKILEEVMEPTLAEAQLAPEERRDLVKLNPELSVTAYRKLPPEKQAIIDKMISIKQGAVTLELVQLPK